MIYDYLNNKIIMNKMNTYQLEHRNFFNSTLTLLKKEIIEYLNPEDMKELWGREIYHGELNSMLYKNGKGIRWFRGMEEVTPTIFEYCKCNGCNC